MTGTSERLLSLLSLLQARRDWPGQVLADRLEVSPRTVRRDVDRLRELGYPIASTKGPDGGYRLEAGSDLPPLLFDEEQAVALTVALQVATAAGAGLGEAALRALTTVRQVMPARLRHRVDALQVTEVAPTYGARREADVDLEVLTTLAAAVHAHEVVRLDYAAPPSYGEGAAGDAAVTDGGAPAPPRRVEPHHVVTRGGRWYLVAWDLDRDDWRTFRVDRVTPRTPAGPRFTPRELPGGDVAAFVTSLFRGGDTAAGTGAWPCRGEVVVDLPVAEVATYTRDGVVEPCGAERTRVVLGSWSWVGLAATLLRYDADVEVVGPPELREAFSALARRCARAGEGDRSGGSRGAGVG